MYAVIGNSKSTENIKNKILSCPLCMHTVIFDMYTLLKKLHIEIEGRTFFYLSTGYTVYSYKQYNYYDSIIYNSYKQYNLI